MLVNDQIAQLGEIAAELRKACQEQTGIDPASDRRALDSAFSETGLTVRKLNRVRDALHTAARTLDQQQECITKLERRVNDLESSNGALMVDRTRGIDEAGTRAEYAWEVAERALEAAGIDSGELADLVAEHTRYDRQIGRLMGEQRERLEAFRIAMIGVLRALEDDTVRTDGLTPIQVGKVRRAIERANSKACGR
jgi:hypothetical protein